MASKALSFEFRANASSRRPGRGVVPAGAAVTGDRRQQRARRRPPEHPTAVEPTEATNVCWLPARLHPSEALEENMAVRNFRLLLCLAMLSASTLAQGKCLDTVSQLKANHIKASWLETTENDGKPLMISIANGANGLVYSARKAGALWLTGNVSVCVAGGHPEITLKNTKATSHVPMIARMALPSTQSAQVVDNRIKLGGGGWGGTFVGQ